MRDATKISEYFYGAKTLFIIPLYQRKYAWQQKYCVRLFEDLKKIHHEDIHSHFFGNIVSVKANEHEDDLLIIDGQQRITTLSLLILAGINGEPTMFIRDYLTIEKGAISNIEELYFDFKSHDKESTNSKRSGLNYLFKELGIPSS